MKKPIMKKTIVFIFLSSFIVILFPSITINVLANTTIHIDFENGTPGSDYESANLDTKKHGGGDFEVSHYSAEDVYDGDQAFLMTGHGWFNLTDSGGYINEIGFYQYYVGSGATILTIFNDTQYTNGDITLGTADTDAIANIWVTFYGQVKTWYMNYQGTWTEIRNSVSGWSYLEMVINSVATATYTYGGTTKAGTVCNTTALQEGLSANRCFFYISGEWNIDNFSFVRSSTPYTEAQEADDEETGYGDNTLCYIGKIPTNFKKTQNPPYDTPTYLETIYNVDTTMTIKRIELICSMEQYTNRPNLDTYRVLIADGELGKENGTYTQYVPNEWGDITLINNAGEYIEAKVLTLSGFEKAIVDDKITIAFAQNDWYLYFAPVDINEDGLIGCKMHFDLTQFQNPYYDGYPFAFEPLVRFYYVCSDYDPPTPMNVDQIFLNPSIRDNNKYWENEPVQYIATAETLAYTTTLNLTKNSVEITDFGFPKTFYSNVITGSISLPDAGNYELYICRQGKQTNKTFEVETRNADFWIDTNPNPSRPSQTFKIKYRYNHAENKDGKIIISTNSDYSKPDNYLQQYNIFENGYNNITCALDLDEGIYYIHMVVETYNNTFYPVGNTHKHIVSNPKPNNLDIYKDAAQIDKDTGYAHSYAAYSHNFLGWTVAIRDGDTVIKDVSKNNADVVLLKFYTNGRKFCTLDILTTDGYKQIANDTITIGDSDITGYKEDTSHKIILGLILSLIIGGICAAPLGMGLGGMAFGSGATAIILSLPEVGMFQLLPEGLGIGIIVFAATVAVLAWLLG